MICRLTFVRGLSISMTRKKRSFNASYVLVLKSNIVNEENVGWFLPDNHPRLDVFASSFYPCYQKITHLGWDPALT